MKLRHGFTNVPRIDRSRLVPEMTALARDVSVSTKDAVQAVTPVKSGLMRRSWKRRVSNTTTRVTFKLWNTAPYGGFVHYKGEPDRMVLDVTEQIFQEAAEVLTATMTDRITAILTEEF